MSTLSTNSITLDTRAPRRPRGPQGSPLDAPAFILASLTGPLPATHPNANNAGQAGLHPATSSGSTPLAAVARRLPLRPRIALKWTSHGPAWGVFQGSGSGACGATCEDPR